VVLRFGGSEGVNVCLKGQNPSHTTYKRPPPQNNHSTNIHSKIEGPSDRSKIKEGFSPTERNFNPLFAVWLLVGVVWV
jgi:hypothetical protein